MWSCPGNQKLTRSIIMRNIVPSSICRYNMAISIWVLVSSRADMGRALIPEPIYGKGYVIICLSHI